MEGDFPNNKLIAFASDTQAPMFVETLWLRSNKNRKATYLLFHDILKAHPHSFFLLGDVVNLGYSDRQWKPIDLYLGNLKERNINVHAILGNHELMGQPQKGERKFQSRFPDHVRTGYVKIIDSVAVILLNSNFKSLSQSEEKKQLKWYADTLENLDHASEIHFIITTCHHSPFTNSRIVRPSAEVEKKFVPLFLSSRKSQLFLSGHSHNFEHYKVQDKDFLVIGGGGGLRQPLNQGVGHLADLCNEYKPMFHYLLMDIMEDELYIKSFHLKSDFSGFEEGWKMEIKKM